MSLKLCVNVAIIVVASEQTKQDVRDYVARCGKMCFSNLEGVLLRIIS